MLDVSHHVSGSVVYFATASAGILPADVVDPVVATIEAGADTSDVLASWSKSEIDGVLLQVEMKKVLFCCKR